MHAVQTSVTIAAPPDLVWNVLTDFARYPAWSSFIQRVDGAAETGTRLDVVIGRAGKRAWRSQPRVRAAEPPRRFSWQGHVGHPAFFATTHEFVLVAGTSGTEVLHSEHFTGLLPALLRKPPDEAYRGFADFNSALKNRAEALAAD